MKPRKPIRKKSSRRKSMQELDLLVKEILIAKRGGRCEHCGGTFRIQGAHILPKGTYKRLRWMELNLLLLCFPCHPDWWHRNPVESAHWLEEKFPGRIEQLYLWARQAPKIDLKELKISLTLEKSELTGEGAH